MESMAEGMIKDLVASGHALADDMTGAPSEARRLQSQN